MANEKASASTSYNQDIQRIENIIQMLSSSDCDIDKMLDYVKEASMLLQRCEDKLAKTGLQVEEALNALNKNMNLETTKENGQF